MARKVITKPVRRLIKSEIRRGGGYKATATSRSIAYDKARHKRAHARKKGRG